PLYDWFIDAVNRGRPPEKKIWHPQQIEFARLNLTYTMLSKRKLLQLVNDRLVRGWDDPRMPTISGYRRRGYTAEAIRAFCKHIGVNKFNSTVPIGVLENFLREDLNKRAARRMAVLRPLKVVITNYPQGQVDELDAINNPEDEAAGPRPGPRASRACATARRARRFSSSGSATSRWTPTRGPASRCSTVRCR